MNTDAARGEGLLHAAFAEHAAVVETCLATLLPPVAGLEARLIEAMRYAALGGGKRLRGFLTMEVASLFQVAHASAARVAASVEMLHAYSLVHDDLPAMDDDDLRRGKPSCHRAFDEATAILAGDALQARAFEVLADHDTHSDPQARCELVSALGLAAGARGMAGGQMIDMESEGRMLSHGEISRLQALKTGRLIQYAAEAGAILGRAAPKLRAQVAAYGRDLGAAFQIADDVLDTVGTAEQIGKTAGKDEASGKATIVTLHGWNARGLRRPCCRSRRDPIWRPSGRKRTGLGRWRRGLSPASIDVDCVERNLGREPWLCIGTKVGLA